MKNIHLIFSAVILIPVALAYGLSPDLDFPFLFDFEVETTDQKNILRAIMGLYLAMVGLWIGGITKPNLWKAATITNVLFMGGLGVGRLMSCIMDGTPSINFFIGMFAEFAIALWGIYNLKKYGSDENN